MECTYVQTKNKRISYYNIETSRTFMKRNWMHILEVGGDQ